MEAENEQKNQIRQLTAAQRRVVGVLMEKAFTTPEQYPLTLKSLTSGCNQKSNRDPVTRYSEDDIQDTVDELRDRQLVAEVFTDGGRAARYRHYMRYRFDFSESQFAIIAELLLRGGQQPGELRTRAGRMVRIESQDTLRDDLAALTEKGFIRSSGPLDRRGVTIDHTFYLPKETPDLSEAAASPTTSAALPRSASESPVVSEDLAALRTAVSELQKDVRELREAIALIENR